MSHGKGKLGCCCKLKKHKFVLTTPKPPAPTNESNVMQ